MIARIQPETPQPAPAPVELSPASWAQVVRAWLAADAVALEMVRSAMECAPGYELARLVVNSAPQSQATRPLLLAALAEALK